MPPAKTPLFALLVALGLVFTTANAWATPSRFCVKLLTESELAALPQDVEAAIAARTQPLREGRPEIQGTDGSTINVLEGINRELARPILDASKRAVLARLEELSKKWISAAKDEIKLRYEEAKKQNAAAGKSNSIEYDADGLPMTPMIQAHRDLALLAIKEAKTKLGPPELESQVVQLVIEGLKKNFATEIKETADEIMSSAEDALQLSLNKSTPDWNSVFNAIAPKARSFAAQLAEQFPLERGVTKATKSATEATRLAAAELPGPVTAQLNAQGVPEIIVGEIGVRAYYDIELGTVVLESSKGMLPNETGVIMVVDHGDGTVKSNASSWKYVLPKFIDSKFNPVAMNLPKAGIGMDITGLQKTAAYLDRRYRVLRARAQPKAGEPALPIVLLGRSMGSAKGYAHALLYDGPQNVVDGYIFTSFSNPMTIDMQIVNVNKQVADGTIKGVVPEMLDNAAKLSAEMLHDLEALRAKNPKEFDEFGDNQLFLQGKADEDGGPTVVEDLLEFQGKYAPRAHVYLFENMLLKYNIPHYAKIDPERWEATHTLLSNLPNMSAEKLAASVEAMRAREPEMTAQEREVYEAMKAIHERVPAKDLPALQDQYFEANAVMYGFFDHLADNPSARPEMQKSAALFKAFRKKFAGDLTFLEWVQAKAKITPQELASVEPGRESKAARLKKVMAYWKAERAKAH